MVRAATPVDRPWTPEEIEAYLAEPAAPKPGPDPFLHPELIVVPF